jgi:hypothetical protein
VSPTDAADRHPARLAADILGNLRRFGIGHNDIVAADAVRGDGDNVSAYSQTSVTSPFFVWRGPTFVCTKWKVAVLFFREMPTST